MSESVRNCQIKNIFLTVKIRLIEEFYNFVIYNTAVEF